MDSGIDSQVQTTPELLVRPSVPALDAILGRPFRVLNDGFVRVVDYLGNDSSIVQAARVSYGAGTKAVSEDRGLIRYLLRHQHTTPFEMCELKLHIRAPMDVWRQWIRHRTANVNEYSTRYSIAIDSAHMTAPDQWRLQSQSNRQGGDAAVPTETGEVLSNKEKDLHRIGRDVYKERLAAGVAREQARKDLPLSTYTEAYWKMDLHNLLNFLWMRMSPHAQLEIRLFANTIGDNIVSKWVPTAWEAFQDYKTNALSLSRLERAVVRSLVRNDKDGAIATLVSEGLLTATGPQKSSRERSDLEKKLNDLGFAIPW